MKTFLFRSLIGIFFGAFLAVVFTNSMVWSGDAAVINGELFVKNSLGAIFCGWFFSVTPLYFENRKLKLPQQTLLHFLTVIVLFFILALGIGWIPFNIKSILSMLVMFLIFYGVSWFAFYLYFKNQAKKLNEDLRKL
jgi:hypothetical protein